MDKKLIQAMLDGKQIIDETGKFTAYFRKDNFFVKRFDNGKIWPLVFDDFLGTWQIKPEPKTRFMTPMEFMQKIIDTPNMVIKYPECKTFNHAKYYNSGLNVTKVLWNQLENCEFKYSEWKKFEVTE